MNTTSKVPPVLGMPHGSIRALLTIMIVAVVLTFLVRGLDIPLLWTETLMIALAHYFTSRRFIKLPPDVIKQLSVDGHVEFESKPLWLPRHSIRAILVLAFAGVSFYLYQNGRLLDPKAISILGVVFAYFLGVLLPFSQNRRWDNLKAVVVLLVMGITATAYVLDKEEMVPKFIKSSALGMVLFYFGSR